MESFNCLNFAIRIVEKFIGQNKVGDCHCESNHLVIVGEVGVMMVSLSTGCSDENGKFPNHLVYYNIF